jgi:mono/diheme cytochrome c family protein
MRTSFSIGLVVVLAWSPAASRSQESNKRTEVKDSHDRFANAQTITAGKGLKLYAREGCGSCHTVAEREDGKYSLAGVGGKLPVAGIREALKRPSHGKSMNPNGGGKPRNLPASELDDLIKYLGTLKKP